MKKAIRRSLLLLIVCVVVVVGYYAYSFMSFFHDIQQSTTTNANLSEENDVPGNESKESTKPANSYSPPKWEGKEPVNILLMGTDVRAVRPNESPRSDSMILASLDPVTKQGTLFSILRDTWVKIPDANGKHRINEALATGGPELAMETVSDLLDVPVQYYVTTDFEGFIALVDALGGIDFDVEKNMTWTDRSDDHLYDIRLKKGLQHLDGKQALQYVRFRHDALSDFTRTERQRDFLEALAQQMQSATSIIKLPKILNEIKPYIKTNMGPTTILKLASLGYQVKSNGIKSYQIPPMDMLKETSINGASVLTVNENSLQNYIKDLNKNSQ